MIYETAIKQIDDLRFRVQARVLPGGLCQQRHVWYGRDGEARYDPWLSVPARRPDRAFINMEPAPHEPCEWQILIDALERIAAGHNDPRALAAEALGKI